MEVNTVTWTPQLLISKKLEFADPYMGIGYQFVSGGIQVKTSGLPIPDLDSVRGVGRSFLSFLGLSLRMPGLGARVTLEGSYSPEGFNSLGTKVGFSF